MNLMENLKKCLDTNINKFRITVESKINQINDKVEQRLKIGFNHIERLSKIDDIATKDIISGVTADQAVLFLPVEAVFAELHAYYADTIEYAQSKHVWVASPTTLIAILTVLQTVVKDMDKVCDNLIISMKMCTYN